MERLCFIFPNRRALVFFKKYLGDEFSRKGAASLAPEMFPMNEFVYSVTGAHSTDKVRLLVDLYDCYKKLNPQGEELDDFIFWGGVLLSDFDDVDKYLVDAERLFTNVSDFKSLQDTYAYLSAKQMDAVERFAGHFSTRGKYKDEFRRIWNILLPLYRNFNAVIGEKGMCYEGQVYRSLAVSLDDRPVVDVLGSRFRETEKFVFVGLNALNECERKLMKRMRDAGLAEFCWDFSSPMIKDPANKSSFFLQSEVEMFPQAFRIDTEGLPTPEFNVVSVPSSVGQAKQLPEILERSGSSGIDTAVILPDESMLIPVLNSIPEQMKDINVTMGYPMNGSELWSLMNDISGLQMHLREKDGKWLFYHRQVRSIFSNSVFRSVLDDEARAIVADIRKSAHYYVSQDAFSGSELLELLFRPIVRDASLADAGTIIELEDYQQKILSALATRLKNVGDMALEIDFAKEYWQAVGRLRSCRLAIRPATYFRLLAQMVGNASVPFRGEPLKGLQIMGPLETRAVDFDNIIILNCNEGMFPRHSVTSSFIPPELRKGFDMPTYEYQDAVWAYYFYRLIQRARKVWMLYDSRTEISRSGEESRYVKQLEMHFGANVNRYVAKSPVGTVPVPASIPKTEEDLKKVHEKYLSASSIQNYIACPARFYYSTVCGLKADEDVSESLDAAQMGTVFHAVMQEIYSVPGGVVTAQYLKAVMKDVSSIRDRIRRHIMDVLKCLEVSGRNIIYEDIVCRYVVVALRRDLEFLERNGRDEFRILGLEKKKYAEIAGFKFIGYIDRLDSISDDEVRVVDYKTGKLDEDKVGLQLFLYDTYIKDEPVLEGRNVVNCVYHIASMFTSPIENRTADDEFRNAMLEKLVGILEEIDNPEIPFGRNGDLKTCACCDFKMICGR